MVDMDVAKVVLDRTIALGKILGMVVGQVLVGLALVPFLDFARYLGVDVTLLIDVVGTFIHVDDDMEQQVDVAATLKRSGNHGHAEQGTQRVNIQLVAAPLGLVIHVQSTHHSEVHVQQLRGEIEVALEVARVDHVDDDVGTLLEQMLPHIQLLGAVARQRVGARQVGEVELIAFKRGMRYTGIDRHTRVVAHACMCSTGVVKQRCLATVWVADESNVDGATLLADLGLQLLVAQVDGLGDGLL